MCQKHHLYAALMPKCNIFTSNMPVSSHELGNTSGTGINSKNLALTSLALKLHCSQVGRYMVVVVSIV